MKKQIIEIQNALLEYYPQFFSLRQSEIFLKYFLELENWRQEPIKLFGKNIMQPRLTSLFGDENKSYSYSGLRMQPAPFPKTLRDIKYKCEEFSGEDFNICLANLYRNGSDSMGWHADDEKELGKDPVIASVSFGEERVFHLKHKKDNNLRKKLVLENGSLLIMKGSTQHFWKHQLPKTKRKVGPRVNLTFRKII